MLRVTISSPPTLPSPQMSPLAWFCVSHLLSLCMSAVFSLYVMLLRYRALNVPPLGHSITGMKSTFTTSGPRSGMLSVLLRPIHFYCCVALCCVHTQQLIVHSAFDARSHCFRLFFTRCFLEVVCVYSHLCTIFRVTREVMLHSRKLCEFTVPPTMCRYFSCSLSSLTQSHMLYILPI